MVLPRHRSSLRQESQPNYRVNGFEIVRLLSREYGIRTRSEALDFKTKLCEKVFRAVCITEVVKHIEYEWSRYMKLLRSLDPGISKDGLFLVDTDLAMLLLRSLDAEVRSYCLMHAKSEDCQGLREAALRFESAQRLWSEFGGRGNNHSVPSFRCNQTGHYAWDCKSSPVQKPSGKAAAKAFVVPRSG